MSQKMGKKHSKFSEESSACQDDVAESSSADTNRHLMELLRGRPSAVRIETIKELEIVMKNASFLETSLEDLTIYHVSPLPLFSKKSRSPMTNLKRLEITKASLSVFPKSILKLQNLKRLYLDYNELTSIPGNIGKLQQLEYLNLGNNKITSLPESLRNLINLKELYLGYNELTSIPGNIGNLQQLEVLKLNNNKITSLPESLCNLVNLKELYLYYNELTSIPGNIGKLQQLEDLNLKFNKITSLPESFCNLINLKRLSLYSNELTSIPGNIGKLQQLEDLNLYSNKITSLPESLCNLINLKGLYLGNNELTSIPGNIGKLQQLEDLNLYSNKITSLPESICNLRVRVILQLTGNPLQKPPLEVCSNGIRAIQGYFEDIKKSKGVFNSKRLKIILVGESGAGKTSLANALVTFDYCDIGSDESTIVLDYYNWVIPEKDLQIRIVDCAGQREYLLTHQFFFTEGALFVLVVDLSKYSMTDSDYKTMVGDWVRIVTSQNPGASILVVPTHLDCCIKENINIISQCKDLLKRLKSEEERQVELLKEKMESVKEEKEQFDRMQHLLKERPKLSSIMFASLEEYRSKEFGEKEISLIPVCTIGNRQGLQFLRQEIVRLSENDAVCPTVSREIPKNYQWLEKTLMKIRKNGTQFLSIESLKAECKWELPDDMLHRALVYMNAIGSIEFFHNVEQVRHLVFIDPTWFVNLLKLLFRHNHEETLKYKEDFTVKFRVLDGQFQSDKLMFFNKGHLSKALLKCIWLPFYEKEDDFPFDNVVQILSYFGLLCKLENEPSSAEVLYFIPWFVPEEEPENARERWEQDEAKSNAKMISTRLETGAAHLPASIICRLLVSVQSKSRLCIPWKKGFLVINKNIKLRCEVVHGEYSSTITLYGRGEERSLQEVWQLTLGIWKELDSLINSWNGVFLFEKYSLCPFCVQKKSSTPRQFGLRERNVQDKEYTCHHCNKVVDCNLIFPPKGTIAELLASRFCMSLSPEYPVHVIDDADFKNAQPREYIRQVNMRLSTHVASVYKAFTRELGIDDCAIDAAAKDHPGDACEACYSLLRKWLDGHDDGPNFKQEMLNKLENALRRTRTPCIVSLPGIKQLKI